MNNALTHSEFLAPRDVVEILNRHKRKAAFWFILISVLTVLFIGLYPRVYRSEAKLYVRVGRESMMLDPTATTGQTFTLHKEHQDEVNSALEILNSRELMGKVVDRIGVERILEPKSHPPGGFDSTEAGDQGSSQADGGFSIFNVFESLNDAIYPALLAVGLKDPISDREQAIMQLQNTTWAAAPKASTVITIESKSDTAEAAQEIVSVLVEEFLEEHQRLSRTPGSYEFFENQVALLDNQRKQATEEVRTVKNKYGVVTVDSEREILGRKLEIVETKRLDTLQQIQFGNSKIVSIELAINGLDTNILTASVEGASGAADGMQQRFYDLQIRENEMLAKYDERHPKVQHVREQRVAVEKILNKQSKNRTSTTKAINPNRQALELALMTEEANVEALQSQSAELEKQHHSLIDELEKLNKQSIEIQDAERLADMLESNYRSVYDKLEQARIGNALEVEDISNINVVQAASFIGRPAWPKKKTFAAIGLLLAISVAVGRVFMAELFDNTLRSAEQIEALTGLPVLVSVPRSTRYSSGMLRQSLRRNGQNGHVRVSHANQLYQNLAGQLQTMPLPGSRTHGQTDWTRSIGIIGVKAGCGASTVAANLARSVTDHSNESVLLIDSDSARKTSSKLFHIKGERGLWDALAGNGEIDSLIQRPDDRGEASDSGEGTNFALLVPGTERALSSAVLSPKAVQRRFDLVWPNYDMVIFDLPPVSELGLQSSLVQALDGIVIVVEAETTTLDDANRVKAQLDRINAHVLGIVLNKSPEKNGSS